MMFMSWGGGTTVLGLHILPRMGWPILIWDDRRRGVRISIIKGWWRSCNCVSWISFAHILMIPFFKKRKNMLLEDYISANKEFLCLEVIESPSFMTQRISDK